MRILKQLNQTHLNDHLYKPNYSIASSTHIFEHYYFQRILTNFEVNCVLSI